MLHHLRHIFLRHILLRAGILALLLVIGLSALSACSLSGPAGMGTTTTGTTTTVGTKAGSPLPAAWKQVLQQIQLDGTITRDTALQAFSLAIGPLPGVTPPGQLDRPLLSGSLAVRALVAHWNELAPEQQQAARQYLRIPGAPSAQQGQALSQGAGAGGLQVAAVPTSPPPPDDPGTEAYRKIINDLLPTLAGDLKPAHTLGIPTVLSWKFDPKLAKDSAEAYVYPVSASNQFTGQVALCPIYLNKAAVPQLSAYEVRLVLAHELMHCFQVDIIKDLGRFYQAPGWLIEGEAMWVGYTHADAVGGGPSELFAGHWGAWFYENLTPLFKRTYDAVGYYALLDAVGVSPWAVFTPMLLASDNASAYQVGAAQAGDPLLDRWAAGNERDASLGTAWDLTGPGLKGLTFSTSLPEIALGSGKSEPLNAAPFTVLNYHLTSQADLIEVAVAGHVRLIDSAHVEHVADASDIYCMKQGGCTCPPNSIFPSKEPQALTGIIHLAVTGGPSGAQGAVRGISLQDYCSDMRSALKRALPQDATFNIESSDAQGDPGPVTGNGVETKTPDLLAFTNTISAGGQSSDYQEVIDFANAAVYFRVVGAQKWTKQSAAIAHWWDMYPAQVVGAETLNGVRTYHILGTVVSGGHTITQNVWVRTDNLYPVQIAQQFFAGSYTGYYLWVVTAYNTSGTITVPTDIAP